MKKIIALLICTGSFLVGTSQHLEKGNVVGQHVGIIVLNPDVTFNQYKNFILTKYIPEVNKAYGGDMMVYLSQSDRGNDEYTISVFYVYKSVEVRNKYYPSPDKPSDLATAMQEKLKPVADQFTKLGRFVQKYYNDWVVQ